MLKILPLFLIFFFSGLFFLKVDNLTQKKDEDSIKNINIEEILTSENQDEININNKEILFVEDELIDINTEKKVKENVITKNNNLDQKLDGEENQIDKIFTKKFSVQFGAFSKEIGAKKLKNKVDEIIKPNFDYFESYIQFNEEKKIYLLKFDSDSRENVKQTCKFSKSKKIDCYVIQR